MPEADVVATTAGPAMDSFLLAKLSVLPNFHTATPIKTAAETPEAMKMAKRRVLVMVTGSPHASQQGAWLLGRRRGYSDASQ
ncbi:hypothetical protein D9B87_03175 [Corynebacterium diphtheriae]|nr:hypothetical protein BU169_05115 [Corynebacterium diphtheriae]RKW85962.1 hypothetical protein D9D07_03485 [Corynebacterium diphtheriae]RKW90357.1 hypothetical protein D9B87_03175 [Corynebacterium diphtheriae]